MYNKHREKSIAEESCSIAEESCLKKGSDEKLNLRFMYPFYLMNVWIHFAIDFVSIDSELNDYCLGLNCNKICVLFSRSKRTL